MGKCVYRSGRLPQHRIPPKRTPDGDLSLSLLLNSILPPTLSMDPLVAQACCVGVECGGGGGEEGGNPR